jgi:hypothetical protein
MVHEIEIESTGLVWSSRRAEALGLKSVEEQRLAFPAVSPSVLQCVCWRKVVFQDEMPAAWLVLSTHWASASVIKKIEKHCSTLAAIPPA